MQRLGNVFFKYRSYMPIPFLIFSIVFMEPVMLSIIIGLIVALSGEIIRIWSVSYAGSETRTTSGIGGTFLVTQGPYSFVRNPLYIGNILIYTGIGIMSFAWFPYFQILVFLFFLFQYYCIILAEEEFLKQKFIQIFPQYKQSVKRFIPMKNTIPENIKSHLTFKIKEGFKSERRSLQAFTVVSIIIIIYYFTQNFI